MLPIQIADSKNNRTVRSRRHVVSYVRTFLATLVTLIGILLMTACADNSRISPPEPSLRSGNFPVVEPFAIDQGGSKHSVIFELPDVRDNGILRPVFIGFRAVNAAGGTEEKFRNSQKVMDYLHEAPMPVRLKLWRIDEGEPKPIVLSDMHWDVQAKRASWHLHPDETFTYHSAASTDNRPLIDFGHYDLDRAYYIHGFARIIPPTPGRYRLEFESLESHPILIDLKRELPVLHYELLVSHYHQRGIE